MANDKKLKELIERFENLDKSLLEAGKKWSEASQKFIRHANKMMQDWDNQELHQNKAESLQRHDNETRKQFFNKYSEAKETKDELDDYLSSKSAIEAKDQVLTQKIRRYRDKTKSYYTDHVIKFVLDFVKNDDPHLINWDYDLDKPIDYWFEALGSEGTADYVDNEFFRRQKAASFIIVTSSLPPYIGNRFFIVKELFSLGLMHATIVFLRSLLEAVLEDYLKKRKRLLNKDGVSNLDSWRVMSMLGMVKNKVNKRTYVKVKSVITKANNVLHAKSELPKISEDFTLEAIQNTITLIEELHK